MTKEYQEKLIVSDGSNYNPFNDLLLEDIENIIEAAEKNFRRTTNGDKIVYPDYYLHLHRFKELHNFVCKNETTIRKTHGNTKNRYALIFALLGEKQRELEHKK